MDIKEFEKKIIVDLIPKGNKNRPGYTMKADFITVHDTGNSKAGADALMHAKYISKPTTADSWHYTVDDQRIVQHLPLTENGWHAGDGKNGAGNRRSIGIEICQNKGIDRAKAEALTTELIAYLILTQSIPIEKVYQHNHWNGKNCPGVIRSRQGAWNELMGKIKANLAPEPVTNQHWGEPFIKRLKELELISSEHKGDESVEWGELAKVVVGMLKMIDRQ